MSLPVALLILVGLALAGFSHVLRFRLLASVAFWVGIILVAFGLILVVMPFLNWVYRQVQQMLGA